MCGIGGIISSQKGDLTPLYRMMAAQAHRGPDGEGYLFKTAAGLQLNPPAPSAQNQEGWWALGHKRLSILDPSLDGLQPFSAAGDRLWLTYNGEIYNYKELKAELKALGHVFRTQTDTEVILASYQEWGVRCFEKFNGMWALALIDLGRNVLILSRDRFGEKPLHVFKAGPTLFFSSEIKGILAAQGASRRFSLNPARAADYLQWGMVNHTQETFFQDIESFPAASYAVIPLDTPTSSWSPQPYWSLENISETSSLSFSEAQETFKALFQSCVALRLRSDVPIGFCLSGGLDSSAIVCAAALENPNTPLETFTAISDSPHYNEKAWADIVNAHVNAHSHFSQVQEEAFITDLDKLLWHQEEPFTTTSIYAQWGLMARAKQHHIPVMLDGQGADEVLCGYRKFYFFYLRQLLKTGQLLSFAKESWGILRRGDRTLLRFQEGLKYLPSFLRSSPLLLPFGLKNSALRFDSLQTILQKQKDDLLRFSVPALLRYEDRNAMAWSIESRVPFLDHRLVEFLLALPPSYKLRFGQTKALLRQALTDFVPASILQRRDKMGFATPQAQWMKNHLGRHIFAHFKSELPHLEKYIHKSQDGPALFRLYLFDQWRRRFDVKA